MVMFILPCPLQINIMFQVVDFPVDGNFLDATLIQLIAKHLRKSRQCFACLFILFLNLEINGVDRIEKKMWIDLCLQVLKLSVQFFNLDFTDQLTLEVPFLAQLQRYTESEI